jgi:hypothetical protein
MNRTIPQATLRKLLDHAAAAAQLVGHSDSAIAAGPLGDHVDAIVHGLTELLGDPRTLAAPHAAASDLAHDGVPMLAASAGGAP